MDFSRKYLKFIKIIEFISLIKPAWLSSLLAANYARFYSPIRINEDKAHQSIITYLGDKADVKKIWQLHLKQHGISSLNIFKLKNLTKQWCQKHVKVSQPELFHEFCHSEEGAVMLTFHVQHQHQFCAILGSCGLDINPLAAAPETSPLYNELKDYIDLLHDNASQHYGKGYYVFLEPEKMNIRPAYRALQNKQIVVSLSDNAGNDENTEEVFLFGKKLNVSTGMVKLAKKHNRPVWVALMYWQSGDNFVMEIKKLDNSQSIQKIMQDYMDFFQNILTKKPEIWEGWQW